MKTKLILFILLFATFEMATAQIATPAPSTAGKVYAKVGLTDITIDYSRPKMKGRKIFGDGDDFLVPFGKIWRTGANSGTIITTDKDLTVEGSNLPAGEYMIITIPGADSWTVIFYKDKSIGGNMANHKEADEQLRVSAKASSLAEAVQTMTFNISDLSEDNTTAAIELAWANTSVKVNVATDFDKEVMADIDKKTKVNPNNYAAAANYYYNTGKDIDQAIEWMGMAIEANPNAFWNIHTKAQMQAKKGDKKGAITTAEASLAKATAAESDFGYIKRNEDFIAELKKK